MSTFSDTSSWSKYNSYISLDIAKKKVENLFLKCKKLREYQIKNDTAVIAVGHKTIIHMKTNSNHFLQ